MLGKCIYVSLDNKFTLGVPVVGYRVYVMYTPTQYACFQLPPTQYSFTFNTSVGLTYGCFFYYTVTPQPISLRDGNTNYPLHMVHGCPVGINLLPLPNVHIEPGASYSFTARFEEEPIPSARVVWYFSPDRKFCKNPQRVENSLYNVEFLQDNRVLKILSVSRQHVGCYVVTAENGVGRIQEQRGYLDLNITTTSSTNTRTNDQNMIAQVEGPLFATIALILAVMAGVALTFTIKWKRVARRRKKFEEETSEGKLLKRKVYISHCMEEEEERMLLLKFVSCLSGSGVDVVVDVCSTVEINNHGGIKRWITKQLLNCNKVLIIATPRYIRDAQTTLTDAKSKVQTEMNLIKAITNGELSKSIDLILLRCKGVDKTDIIHPLDNLTSFDFPENFDVVHDDNLMSIMNALKY